VIIPHILDPVGLAASSRPDLRLDKTEEQPANAVSNHAELDSQGTAQAKTQALKPT
jgi:hypothetical protein